VVAHGKQSKPDGRAAAIRYSPQPEIPWIRAFQRPGLSSTAGTQEAKSEKPLDQSQLDTASKDFRAKEQKWRCA